MRIIDSIRIRPINLTLIICVSILYFINNTVLKLCTTGHLQLFFICHFNDLICPLFFLSYSNLLLITIQRELTKIKGIVLLCLIAGLIWEYFTPLIKPSSVSDIVDIICYLVGASLYWFLLTLNNFYYAKRRPK